MVSKHAKGDFGRFLQACRLASGRSLDEIAQQTKITKTCLQQIENEDLLNLPQPVYVKGLLRAYAEVVGCDAEETLQRYQNRCGMRQYIELNEKPESSAKSFWFRFLLALVLFALAIGATLYTAQAGMVKDTLKGPGSGQVINFDLPLAGRSGSLER
jgi:cytoskeletal protein RodZ